MAIGFEVSLGVGQADTELLRRYYAAAAPLMAGIVGGIPFVWPTLPKGIGGPTIFHGPLSPHTVPKAPVMDVPTASEVHRYPLLSAERVRSCARPNVMSVMGVWW